MFGERQSLAPQRQRGRKLRPLSALLLLLAGCMQQYQPRQWPLFMRDPLDVANSAVAEPDASETAPLPRVLPEAAKENATVLTVTADPPDVPDAEALLAGAAGSKPAPLADASGSGAVSLNDAIAATLNADPQLASAREMIRQAQAEYMTASLPPNPQFFMDSQLNPLGQHWTPKKQGGPPQMDWYFNWPIDWYLFGKRAAQMSSARLGADQSSAEFANRVRQRIAAVVDAYFDVLEAKAFVALEEQNLKNLEEVEDMTRKRVKLGGVGPIELDRVRLAVLGSQRELRSRQNALVTASAKLLALMGERGRAVGLPIAGNLQVPVPSAPPTVEESLRLAEESRPDLAALRVQVAKAEADIQVEQARAWPLVNPAFGFTHQFQAQTIGFPDARSWNVALTMGLPVFDRNQGNILKAQARKSQALFDLRAQQLTIQAEIEQALQEFRVAHLNVTQNDAELLATARRVRERLTAAYQLGGQSYLAALDAQRAYWETYRLFIISQSNYWHALNRVNAAIGRQVVR